MTIKIDNDYPEFRVTDTLHQLVDRLNTLTGLLDSNIRLFDSSVNNILGVVDSDGSGLEADSDLVIVTKSGKIDVSADSSILLDAGTNLTLRADEAVTIDAGTTMFLNTDSGEILLRSLGTQFGALKKADNAFELEIHTGLDTVLTFDSELRSSFSGEIGMPASGTGAPTLVTARTVDAAIDEIVSEHDSDHSALETRVAALEPLVTGLRTDVDVNTDGLSNLDSDLTIQQALNISNRLDTIESQIIQINNRLDILEIFT
jgi:hypothetical protein